MSTVSVDRTVPWDVILWWLRVSACESTVGVYRTVCRDVILCAQCGQCSYSQIPILAECSQYLTVRALRVSTGKWLRDVMLYAQWVSDCEGTVSVYRKVSGSITLWATSNCLTLSTLKVSSTGQHSLVLLHTLGGCLPGYTWRMSIQNVYR